MSLFEELKRRNVFRVGIAYIVAAWLLVQVADLALDIIGAEDWVLRAVAALLAIGFVPAIIFAWAFELTPEGIKREKEVNRDTSITHVTAKKLDYVTIGLLVAVLAVVAIDRFLPEAEMGSDPVSSPNVAPDQASTEIGSDPVSEKSIAVLPFVNMSSDAEQEYFSDGISEEILNALAKVKDLKVAGRTSSFAFKGENQDLRKVGEALGVANILEGSVRKSGNKVRITAQLIQVEDGFHLWSESYDRELTDVFAIQDEISGAILEQLKAHLLEGEQQAVVAQRADTEAYDLYLLAKQRIYERSRPALESAAELLDKVIAADGQYAPAYAERAITTLLLSNRNYGTISPTEATAKAKEFIDKALQLDPQQAEAMAALGLYHMNRPGENELAIAPLEQALKINPNLVNASNWLQNAYRVTGKLPDAIRILEDLRERDPLYRPGITNLNSLYIAQNRLDEARDQIDHLREFMPNDPFLLRLDAELAYNKGQLAEGLQIAERALSIQPDMFTNKQLVGVGLERTGQFERLVEEGSEFQKPFALMYLGRKEEALGEAHQLAASGEDPGLLLGIMANYGMAAEMVKYFDEHWQSLDAYESDFPTSQLDTVGGMLDLAYGFSVAGDQIRFGDAMRRSRAGLDRLASLGFSSAFLDLANGIYYAMAGDHEQAIRLLGSAVDRNYLSATKLSEGWTALEVLAGDPTYEAIQARMIESVNKERAELGLEPLKI
jgi:TolB-like protein